MSGFELPLLRAFTSAWWFSVGLGGGIGLAYSLASLVLNRYAMRQDQRRFMLLVFGGMMIRMAMALALVALVYLSLDVEQTTFIGSFFCVFVIGLIGEVWSLHRRMLTAGKT